VPEQKDLQSQLESLQQEVKQLRDAHDIIQLIDRYGSALDEKRWDDWEGTFAEDVVTDYPWGINHGREGMGQKAAELLKEFKLTEHLSANVIIEIDGDKATSRRNVWIICVRPDDVPGVHFTEGGVYTCEHVRTPEGWRFSSIKLDIKWTVNGDPL
jgi:3-phenylpropionate/cinnamic acid dioxygenase small subunit